MSKKLMITIYTKHEFCCTSDSAMKLLRAAGWSCTDSDGLTQNGSDCCFSACKDNQTIKIWINPDNSFTISPEAYARKTSAHMTTHFDFNWYYELFVQAFNKNETIVERVVFDEY